MMKKTTTVDFKELPVTQIHSHIDYAPRSFGESTEDQWLIKSMVQLGQLVPLVVTAEAPDVYRIIDGHRRYLAAVHLGFDSLLCAVRLRLSRGEYDKLRFDLNHTHKPLSQAERRAMLERIVKLGDEL